MPKYDDWPGYGNCRSVRSLDVNTLAGAVVACAIDDIDEEDVLRFGRAGASYALYRLADGFYTSDGLPG